MKIEARAKINAILDIVGRRPDGYHELDTVFAELSLHDTVKIEKTDTGSIEVSCSNPELACDESNLAYKAAKLLMDTFGLRGGVSIYIEKNIPMGAGLGGGSTDAAAVLKGMNALFDLGLSGAKLRELGARLGADVPFFIYGGVARAGGIGEKLTQIPGAVLPPMLVVKPECSVPTVWAYKAVDALEKQMHPDAEAFLESLRAADYEGICRLAGNSFEPAVVCAYPQIREAKQELLDAGADAAVMTGSGAAVFAFFKDKEAVFQAQKKLQSEHPEWKLFPETGGEDHYEKK